MKKSEKKKRKGIKLTPEMLGEIVNTVCRGDRRVSKKTAEFLFFEMGAVRTSDPGFGVNFQGVIFVHPPKAEEILLGGEKRACLSTRPIMYPPLSARERRA